MNSTENSTETKLTPPTEKESAIDGWKMQRRAVARERAESAAWSAALSTGRRIIGGQWTVPLPDHLSSAKAEHVDEHGRELVTVDLDAQHAETRTAKDGTEYKVRARAAHIADPRAAKVWDWSALVTEAERQAMKARAMVKPRPSEEDARDAAAEVIASILKRTRQGMPERDRYSPVVLRTAAARRMIDDRREDRNAARDADADAVALAEDIAEHAETIAPTKRPQRAETIAHTPTDAYGRPVGLVTCERSGEVIPTGPSAAPLRPEAEHVLRHMGATKAERIAVLADWQGMRSAEIMSAEGMSRTAVTSAIARGRNAIARRGHEDIMSARAEWQRVTAPDAEDARQNAGRALWNLIAGRPVDRARDILPTPDRTEDGAEHPVHVSRLVGRTRTADVLAHIARHID